MSYMIRLFRSKGGFLVLIWTFFAFTVLTSPTFINTKNLPYYGLGAVCFPIFGCLSDMYIRRYKVVRYSLWLIWSSLIFYNVLLVLELYVLESLVLAKMKFVAQVSTLVGSAGILANTIQFGIDQLTDASSSDITSYISWYIWSLSLTYFVAFSQICLCGVYNTATSFFVLPLLGTLAIVSDFLFSKWLVKEPVTNNPFKLIHQVLRYAVKNKYPRLRSAFTYWEDKPYSRIDLGKSKYGGPFTTEQVEDVKTFFRILTITIASTPLTGLIYIICNLHFYSQVLYIGIKSCDNTSSGKEYMTNCYKETFILNSLSIIIILFVPIFELLLYPLLIKCSCYARIMITHKILLGVVLIFIYEVWILIFEITGTLTSLNHNSTCHLYPKYEELTSIQVNYKWLLLPQAVLGIAIYVLFSSSLEFLSAQSPYSMKGLLIGMLFISHGLSISLTVGLLKLLQKAIIKVDEKCRIWFHVVLIGFTAVMICIQFVILKCYTFKKRDETLSNDQMFAVDYFNKYLSRRSSTAHDYH